MDVTIQKGFKCLNLEMQTIASSTVETFELGKVYYKDNIENPRIATKDGYHFCESLEKLLKMYPDNGKKRYFNIDVLGNYTHSSDKSVTTAFRLVSEITKEELDKEKDVILKRKLETNLHLEEVRFLQTQNQFCHVGGSVALFLHGLNLKRWEESNSDLDIICPFFFKWKSEEGRADVGYQEAKSSGNDFDEVFIVNSTKTDVRIDNKQRYKVINYNGFDYKVSELETVLAAKLKYAQNGQSKHKEDIYKLLGLKIK